MKLILVIWLSTFGIPAKSVSRLNILCLTVSVLRLEYRCVLELLGSYHNLSFLFRSLILIRFYCN